nr:uncharacterized protein LOC109774221 [Aegilops tauschii subsp. strangulata]
MLLGFCAATYEILDWDMGPFFIAATIRVRASLRVLAVVQVYGPADHSRSAEFLGELQDKVLAISAAQTPVLVGGDFNLIRSGADKNNSNVNWPRVAMFNNAIASMALREVARTGAREEQRAGLRADVWLPSQRVLDSENAELGLAFLPKEIDDALNSMKADTAPGPDGWPVAMFKRFWPLLRDPIFEVCNGFMRGMVDIARLNYGVLSLIPKVSDADNIRQFRPIALINVPFKICAKACTSRLIPIAHRTISRSQSAFIRGRHILEGPLALQEVLHELKRTNEPAILLKLDFEKAYDHVNWDFLRQVLLSQGFSAVWVHCVMQLVSGGQTVISVNGEVGHFFHNKRGLRQGDPMSPILFNFVVDALAAMLRKATEAGHIKDLHSVASVKAILLGFELMSGLKINFHKCEVLPMGLDAADGRRIADLLNCKISQGEAGLWADLLRAKYFPNGSFFQGATRGSPFWNDLQSVRQAFTLGAKFAIGDGRSARFWLDLWIGTQPLWVEFQDLYSIAVDPDLTVASVLSSSPPAIYLRRELSAVEQASLEAMQQLIGQTTLSRQADSVSWTFTASGKFTVRSLYRRLCQGPSLPAYGLWKARLPLKIKVFFWQLFRNRLPTSDNVAKR